MSKNNGKFTARGLQVTPNGTLCLLLRGCMVELTIDGGIYVMNLKNGIAVTISACGELCTLKHPKGKVFSYLDKVEIQANHQTGFRYAKMSKKGVSFTTSDRAVTFLLDAGGPKTTIDKFSIMNDDFISNAFYLNSCYGDAVVDDAFSIMNDCQYWWDDFNVENWKIGKIFISQSIKENIRVSNDIGTYEVSLDPIRGCIMIKHPQFQCTASNMIYGHLFVRKGDQRIHYDGNLFVVRNCGQSAAIDRNNEFKVLFN